MIHIVRLCRRLWPLIGTAALAFLTFTHFATSSLTALAAPPEQGQDLAVITEPTSNAVVSGVVRITGSSDHPAFQFYIIEYAPEPANNQWQAIGGLGNQPVIDGQLAVWNTSVVPDGSYTLRLRTVRQDGNYTEFFATQIVVSNSQATPTPTAEVTEEPTEEAGEEATSELQIVIPTETPTPLPPTPTIVIEQPVVDTPTPRPVETSAPLEDPAENSSFIPTVSGFSVVPLRDACLYGGLLMLSVFVLFGFLSALRAFFKDMRDRQNRK